MLGFHHPPSISEDLIWDTPPGEFTNLLLRTGLREVDLDYGFLHKGGFHQDIPTIEERQFYVMYLNSELYNVLRCVAAFRETCLSQKIAGP